MKEKIDGIRLRILLNICFEHFADDSRNFLFLLQAILEAF